MAGCIGRCIPNSNWRSSMQTMIDYCFPFGRPAKTDKEKPHVKQPTAEQIRIAQITEISTGSDDPKMREKVASLMETTQRTEEEVCCALYECDNDLDRAVIFLFETLPVVSVCTRSAAQCALPARCLSTLPSVLCCAGSL